MVVGIEYTEYAGITAVLIKTKNIIKDGKGVNLKNWLADLKTTSFEHRMVLIYGDAGQAIRTIVLHNLLKRFKVVARWDNDKHGFKVISSTDMVFRVGNVIPEQELHTT